MYQNRKKRPYWVPVAYAATGLVMLAVLGTLGWLTPGAGAALAVLVFVGSYWMNEIPTAMPEPQQEATVDTAVAAAILNALPDPVVLLTKKREVYAMNRAAIELLGEDAKGHDISQSLRHPEIIEGVNAAISGGKAKRAEITLLSPVRSTFEAYATALPKGGLGSARAILVLHNVTLARQAEEMRADFVANVSHELRSPLSALVGFIETLQGAAKDDPAAQEKFLGVMEGEADRMARLIDDLLSLARIEANEHIRPKGSVDVADIVTRVASILGVKAQKRSVTLETDIKVDTMIVSGDADQLTEVFQNLIDNAIKYGPEAGVVRITLSQVERIPGIGGRGVGVSVRNGGEPISAEHLPRLTERFYRIDKGRSRQMGGTGLGLAIVKHIVAHHRGRMIITSDQQQGTIFTVYLPEKQ